MLFAFILFSLIVNVFENFPLANDTLLVCESETEPKELYKVIVRSLFVTPLTLSQFPEIVYFFFFFYLYGINL